MWVGWGAINGNLTLQARTSRAAGVLAPTTSQAWDPLTRLASADENASPSHPLPQGGEGNKINPPLAPLGERGPGVRGSVQSAIVKYSVGHPTRRMRVGLWGLVAVFAVVLMVPALAHAQSAGNVLLESNEQLFYVLAAANAAGYDAGLGGGSTSETRRMVREFLQAQNTPILPEMKKFYDQHRIKDDPGKELGQYISLALMVGPAPDFKLTVPEGELPPDARDVAGFLPLLRTYYGQARMLFAWSRVQKQYDAAVARYTDAVRQNFVETEAYMRLPAGGYLGRTYAIYIDLMGAPEQVNARIYGLNYYLVVTPSEDLKLNEIRFQYMHFILDPLAAKYGAEIDQKIMLRTYAMQAPLPGPGLQGRLQPAGYRMPDSRPGTPHG